MERSAPLPSPDLRTSLLAVVELSKPVTWFPPMWAFGCGVVSSGQFSLDNIGLLIFGVLLAGPLLCAGSQAVNDWFDREVDAINEPGRPIPSGRIPGRWGLWIAIFLVRRRPGLGRLSGRLGAGGGRRGRRPVLGL